MGLYKAGGGGKMTETTLWTNSSPTSSFANQTVTLSQSITAFDYIRIYFRTQNTQDNEFSAIYLASEVNTWVESSSTPRPFGILCGNQGTNTRKRLVMYVSNTSLSLSHATGVNNSTTVDAALIPTKITGLKL